MKQTKHLNKALLSIITTLGLGGAITGSTILAYTTTNVDKLELLTRAVKDNTVEQLQSKRGDIVVELGEAHSAAIINGALYTWGWNSFGQLGLGDTRDRETPTQVIDATEGSITQIALGDRHSAAIVNGALYTWGSNSNGQLGLTDTAPRDTPTKVTELPSGPITQIALGGYQSAAIVNGALYTWGWNAFGQLGIDESGTNSIRKIPTPVPKTSIGEITPGTVTQITLGYSHSAAVIGGELYTWGDNRHGQLGLGESGVDNIRIIPTLVQKTTNGVITEVKLGGYHSAAVIGGALYTWGLNDNGQLGLGDTTPTDIPTEVTKLLSGPITQIALGWVNSAAVIGGELYTWGDNAQGQLGLDNLDQRNTPTHVTKLSNNIIITPESVTQVKLGAYHSAAVINGVLYTSGQNLYGQLGIGKSFIKNVNVMTQVAQAQTGAIQENIINLDPINDIKNIRNKIVYNVTLDDIKTFLNLNQSSLITFKSKIGTTSISGNDVGQLIVAYISNSKKYETTFNGFKPVNQTQSITIAQKSLSANGVIHFSGNDVNKLVTDANADTTGKTNKLAKWIIDNSSLIIGNTTNEYTQDFPMNALITKVSDVNVVNGAAGGVGTISFKIEVDKYYKQSNNNLVESTTNDTAIILENAITLTGFNAPAKSNPSVITNSDRNLNATELLALFGNTNNVITGTGLENLNKYIDLSSFPTSATFKIINHSLNGTSLSIQIEATGYYDDNGILSTGSKQFAFLTINGLEDGTSILGQANIYDKLIPNTILQYIGYDSNNPTKPLITANLLDYVTIQKAFPIDVEFTLASPPIISPNRTELTLSIKANTWTNVDGSINPTSKIFGPFTYSGLSIVLNTNITLKAQHNTDLLAGDLITKFGWNNVIGSFDRTFVNQYVNFSSGVKDATYTMINLIQFDNGKISFSIVADRIYIDGIDTNIETTYDFEITGLKTIIDSASISFLKQNISGNGDVISNQIIDHFSVGTVLGYNDELWNNLFDVSIYPQNTTFTINEIIVTGVISKTFNIKFTASNYYQDNTTMNVNAPIRTVIVNNLKFTPTSVVIKNVLPNIDAYQLFTYIGYNDVTKSFNPITLQEFINLEGFDLTIPGTTTKLIDPKVKDYQVTFNLEVQNYIGENGLLVNETKIFKITIDGDNLPSIALTDNQDQSSLKVIIGATIGGGIGFFLLVILAGLLIRRNKNK